MSLRRRLTFLTGSLGIAIVAIACYVGKDRFEEMWQLWKLRAGSREEQRAAAARLVDLGSLAPETWYLRELESGFEDDRRTAIRQLGELRSAAAVPRLIELFKARNTRRSFSRDDQHIREALTRIGESAARPLVELTIDDSRHVRTAAWAVLKEMGDDAVRRLAAMLSEERDALNYDALREIWRLDERAGALVPRLVEFCDDGNPDVRAAALLAIVSVGSETEGGVRALHAALHDEDKGIRLFAARHLAEVGDARGDAAVPQLIAAVRDDSVAVIRRRTAVRLLGQRRASEAVPVLVEALRDEWLKGAAARALGQIGSPAKPAIPTLESMTEQGLDAAEIAARAILAIRGESPSTRSGGRTP